MFDVDGTRVHSSHEVNAQSLIRAHASMTAS